MAFRDALDQIVAIEGALSISITTPSGDVVTQTVKKAYKHHPRQSQAMPDLPAIFNSVSLPRVERGTMMRTRHYQVHVQCVVGKAGVDDDQKLDIATAFLEEALDAFDEDLSLGNTVTIATFRGDEPTVGLLEHGREAYIGFSGVLDIQMTGTFAFS